MKDYRDELIIVLNKRLHWYTFCTEGDDFNVDEMLLILKLLDLLDPMPCEPDRVRAQYEKFKRMIETGKQICAEDE